MADTPQTDASREKGAAPRWWRYVGLRRGRRLSIVPNRWGWLLILAFVGLVGFLGLAEYSMQPDFCRSCHIMEPYYQAWHNSTHADVPCGDCHFKPGWRNTVKGKWQATSQAVKFVTGTYSSKPHAEIHDASCLRSGCHERRVLEGRVKDWEVQTQRGDPITIRFDHTPHLTALRRGKRLRCVSCHSQIVQGQHIVVTLDTCFLCHFKGLKHGRDEAALGGCRACHDAPSQEIRLSTGNFQHAAYIDRGVACENCHVEVIAGDGSVPRQVCWTCHNKPQHLARYGDTSFLHKQHVTDHKVECSDCHVQIVHALDASPGASGGHAFDEGTCGQCHEQLHSGPQMLYRGTGGRGVPDMPSPMFRTQVDCIACHLTRQRTEEDAAVTGQTFVAAQEACDHCHGEHYHDRLIEWKQIITADLARAHEIRTRAQQGLAEAGLDAARALELNRLLDDAAHNIRLVELGHGVHNVTYATALLNVAIENCGRIEEAVRTPTRAAEASR